MPGDVDDNTSFETLSSLDALFELDEMSDGKFSQALKAGELSELVVTRPDIELSTSSLLNESAVECTKRHIVRVLDLRPFRIPWIRSIIQ